MEARKRRSTITDHSGTWKGQKSAYRMKYNAPLVVGQVMTYEDPAWSTFWCRGRRAVDPPSRSDLYIGKHVGGDPNRGRADETLGYIVLEQGKHHFSGITFLAGLGPDTVQGMHDNPPYAYTYKTADLFDRAIATQAGMDGGDGSWAVLYGFDPVSSNAIQLVVDEDQRADEERNHTTEQVSYLVWTSRDQGANRAPIARPDEATTKQGVPVEVPVLDNDRDPDAGDRLTVASAADGLHGTTMVHSNNTVTYAPSLDFAGVDTFTYIVADQHGASATGHVQITVTPMSLLPVIRQQPLDQLAVEGQQVSFEVVAESISPLRFQWERDGTPISGATTAIYHVESARLTDDGAMYGVILRNDGGSVTSRTAMLTVFDHASVLVRFAEAGLGSYGGTNQDIDASQFEILDEGRTLHLWGNNWKALALDYTVLSNSILEFDFKSEGARGEINAIGLDSDLTLTSEQTFQVYGSQIWGDSGLPRLRRQRLETLPHSRWGLLYR